MTPPTTPVIAATGLERRFGSVVALRSVAISVAAGEVVLLAGPNGAGKSTLLRTLAGLARPTRGIVEVHGISLRNRPEGRGAIGFLSHQNFLYDDLTARENLRFAAALHGVAPIEQRVTDALDAAGLMQRADSRVSQSPAPLSTIPPCSCSTNPFPASTRHLPTSFAMGLPWTRRADAPSSA